jgi:TolA-binding protein
MRESRRHRVGSSLIFPVARMFILTCLALVCLAFDPLARAQPVAQPAKSAVESSVEESLFVAAMKALDTGGELVKHAEAEFAVFLEKFPQSGRAPEATLRQAQCRFNLGDCKGALTLLQTGYTKAGDWTDEYLFWISECLLRERDFRGAETGFAQLLRDFPESGRALAAAYGYADALLKQKKYADVIALLSAPEGVFRVEAARKPKDETVVLGLLALGEAYLSGGRAADYPAVSAELFEKIESDPGAAIELKWRWHHLEYRNSMAEKQYEKAVASAENLVHLSGEIVDAEWRAESIVRKAEAQLALERIDDAVETYRQALAPGMPKSRQREALNRIVMLRRDQNKNAEAIRYLRMIETNYPSAPDLDLVFLTVGELSLEAFEADETRTVPLSPALLQTTTNYLGLAKAQFDALISRHAASVHLGAGLLHRGECHELVGDNKAALKAFAAAAEAARARTNRALLARALCKVGDAHFKLTNHLAAATNYQAALVSSRGLPETLDELGGRALYQTANAGIRMQDLELAREALDRLGAEFPKSPRYARAALMVGQAMNGAGQYDDSLQVYSKCLETIEKAGENPPAKAELMLAMSSTYGSMGDWPHAIAAVEAWLGAEGNAGHPLGGRAEFELGRLRALSGDATNAFASFTNFVTRWKTNELAAHAHFWLADHYFNQGEDSAHLAEKHYQLVFQNTNWPSSELTWRAQFQAGRCALMRQGRNEARDYYFKKLVENRAAPSEWRARALYAIGDTFAEEGGSERWSKAINAFNEIVDNYTNAMVHPLALGRIGDCNRQMGGLGEPKRYDDAMGHYQLVVDHPRADVTTRSQAMFGLAEACQAKARLSAPPDAALLAKARKLLSEVFRSTRVDVSKGERPDPYWVERAGRALSSALAENGDASASVSVLEGLKRELPHLRVVLDREIKALKERQVNAGVASSSQFR